MPTGAGTASAVSGHLHLTEARDSAVMVGAPADIASAAIAEARDAMAVAGWCVVPQIAATEGADIGSLGARVETAILSEQESSDVPTITGVFAATATVNRYEFADDPVMYAAVRAASMAPVEGRDTGSITASFAAQASPGLLERDDIPAISASAHNGTTLQVTEARDIAAISVPVKTSGTIAATERGDAVTIVAGTTITVVLAIAEGADGAAILTIASGLPPYFKVKEAGDVASILGGSPTLSYNVYASPIPDGLIDYSAKVATTGALTWTSGTYGPGTWSFGVRAYDDAGEEQNLDCAITIILDANGNDVSNMPLPPVGLRATALKNGSIKVEWTSAFAGPASRRPTAFLLYMTPGTTPDYGTVAATVAATSGLYGMFAATLTGGLDEQTYAIACRAQNQVATETNTNFVTVVAEVAGPSRPVAALTATNTP